MGSWLTALLGKIKTLKGWRGHMLSFAAGLLLIAALPPLGLWPLIFLAYPVLYIRLDAQEKMSGAFFTGWLFGFAQFLIGLYWMGAAFLVEAEKFLWLMPFAVTLLPAGLGLFHALALAFWFRLKNRFDALGLIYIFIVFLCLADYARGHVLTGLPWNLPGMALLSWMPLAQSASLWGVYGLSLLAIWVGMFGIIMAQSRRHASAILLAFFLVAVFGMVRLSGLSELMAASGLQVRIVQPSIPQKLKWNPDHRLETTDIYFDLTAQEVAGGFVPELVIWPETALPVLVDQNPYLRAQISRSMPPQAKLIMGAVRRDYGTAGAKRYESFNSLMVLQNGEVIKTYDKSHLVPFGEYLPFQALLKAIGLEQLTRLRGSFKAGPGLTTIALDDGLRFSPLICYEAIFPGAVTAPNSRPDVLINITNDGWFGRSAGPHQHFAMARMRAIEEGLPLIRAANTGISAMIDAKGRVISHLPLYHRGVIDTTLPKPLPATVYSQLNDLLFWLICFMLLSMALIHRQKS